MGSSLYLQRKKEEGTMEGRKGCNATTTDISLAFHLLHRRFHGNWMYPE